MSEHLVSVVIPSYNRAKYIAQTIQSILDQSYQKFEIIISDDGSTDDTKDVLAGIDDKRINCLWNEHIGTPSAMRNIGIKNSLGEYVAFLDSDDLWMPDKLELQLNKFEGNPKLGLVCTNGIHFNEEGEMGPVHKTELDDTAFTFDALLNGNPIIASSTITRRSILDEVGQFDESPDLKAGEDYHLWLRIAKKYSVEYLHKPLIKYRTHLDIIRKDDLEGHYVLMKSVFGDLRDRKVIDSAQYSSIIGKLERTYEYETFIDMIRADAGEQSETRREMASQIIHSDKINLKDKNKLISRLVFHTLFPKKSDRATEK
jgi:glycosyltransferase involved in cell wall biosynthesis